MLGRATGPASNEPAALVEGVAVVEVQHDHGALLAAQQSKGVIPVVMLRDGWGSGPTVIDDSFALPARSQPLTVMDTLSHADTRQPRIAACRLTEAVPGSPGRDHDLLHHVFGIVGVPEDDGCNGEEAWSRQAQHRLRLATARPFLDKCH